MNTISAKKNPFGSSNVVGRATISIGAEAANIINVAIQLFGAGIEEVGVRAAIRAYLSDDAEGDDIVATAPTTVAIGTDGVCVPLVTGKMFELISESDGDIDLNITLSSGAATYYLNLIMPDGSIVTSGAITFAA